MHELPLGDVREPSPLERHARRRILGLGYDPTGMDAEELQTLMTAADLLGVPCAPVVATLAIVRHDPPALWREDDPLLRCVVCHGPIHPRRVWLLNDRHPIHRACRPLELDPEQD